MSFEHIIWDWNGTLLDDVDLAIHSMNLIMADKKMNPLSKKEYFKHFGFPVSDYYRKIGFDLEQESMEELSDFFVTNYRNHLHMTGLHHRVDKTLKNFSENGLTQSILSAAEQNGLHEIVKHFGIREYFTDLVGLDDHQAKSKVERGQAWIKNQQINVDKTIMIGDTIHDYEVAKALGCHCALVAHGHQPFERLELQHGLVFKNLEEVEAFILK
ncbi:HAD family hydrolase [Vallitalea okinawensis]|uniref:HAD family hydrolase n=1 Tax=Vallitalea okinawensis TaxID=2078660 RepID=UPI0013009B54|nr:HAD family hydrolase [Vallitalea okinawensis]